MSAIDDFLRDHALWPWPDIDMTYEGAPAAALHAAYRAYLAARDPDLRVLSPAEFGVKLREAGHEHVKIESGHVYPRLTLETRDERATAGARDQLRGLVSAAATEAAWRDHRDRKHGDGSYCSHSLPPAAMASIREHVDEAMATMGRDGSLAAVKEAQYGAWLRHDPAEPDPGVIAQFGRLWAERGRILADLAPLRGLVEPEPFTGPRVMRDTPGWTKPDRTGAHWLDGMMSEMEHTPEYKAYSEIVNAFRAAQSRRDQLETDLTRVDGALRRLSEMMAVSPKVAPADDSAPAVADQPEVDDEW